MYSLKLHDKVYDDLKVLDNALVIKVFKKLKQIQQSPQIGENLGNKNGMNLSGFKKVYIDKKRVRIVFEVQDDILTVYTIAIGQRDDMEVYEIVAAIHDMTTYKMDIRDLIDLMMVWYRDVLILKATEDINQLVYQDEHKYLQKKATTSSYEGLNNIMEALEKAKVRLNANVNFDITMEMLLLTIKEN